MILIPVIQVIVLIIGLYFAFYFLLVLYLAYRGSNYLPTPKSDIKIALSRLHQGDTFMDLGFGNGEVLDEALRKRAGTIIGYELDPVKFIRTWWRLRHHHNVHLYYQDIWSASLVPADVVFTFFTVSHMKELYSKAKREMRKGSWFISYVHEIAGLKPTKTIGQVRFYKI